LSFFLPNRNWLKLVPVASVDYAGSEMEKFYLTVQKGKYKSIGDLKGKTVASNVFKEDKRFINKFIFNNKIDAYSYFKTSFTTSVRGSVRNLQKGKLDAIILNHRDYMKFKDRKDFESLEVLYTSDDIPSLGLMMNDSTYNRSMKDKFLDAVIKMNSMQEAQTMFKANGISGFRKINTGLIDNAISKFDSGN
jgi:ABC-type phosphate/phosphonate transport system substrate-binding protein